VHRERTKKKEKEGVCKLVDLRGCNGSRRFYVRTYVPLRIRLLTTYSTYQSVVAMGSGAVVSRSKFKKKEI